MEQVLDDACEWLPKRQPFEIGRMLVILKPWFKTVELSIERRVISTATDVQFMRFSCFTFVHTVMTAFHESIDETLNNEIFNLWKNLVMSKGRLRVNFTPVILLVLFSAYHPGLHRQCQEVIRHLFRIAPSVTTPSISLMLTCGSALHRHYHEEQEAAPSLELIECTSELDPDYFVLRETRVLYLFLLKVLNSLVSDSILPFIRFLPIIFSFCLIHIHDFFDFVCPLVQHILTELLPVVSMECAPFLHEAARLFNYFTGTIIRGRGNESIEQFSPPDVNDIDADLRTAAEAITNFFLRYDPDMAQQMGISLLQWGLCHGNLNTAGLAISCYCANLCYASPLIVSLSARAVWSVSDAISHIQSIEDQNSQGVDLFPYYRYISQHLIMLRAMAGDFAAKHILGSDSTLLWIAIECLRCNTQATAIVFESALDLFEYIVSSPGIFSFLAHESEPAADKLSMPVFTRFHQPWGDVFHGIWPWLSKCDPVCLNVPKVIRVINCVLQTGFLALFSDGANASLVALLALMPWMWYVVITNTNRFLFDSPDVLMMDATLTALKRQIQDEIIHALDFLDSAQEVDIFLSVTHLCSVVVPMVATEDLLVIVTFFTSCVDRCHKSMRSPIYSVATGILNCAIDKPAIAAALAPFTRKVLLDQKESRRSYREMYLEAFEAVAGPADDQSHEFATKIDHSWPDLKMFSRIVAVTIPHLYEVGDAVVSSMKLNDLNGFPPLLPFEPVLLSAERFRLFENVLRQHRFEPFMGWWENVGKLTASLIITEDLDLMKHTVRVSELDLGQTFSKLLDTIEVRGSGMLEEYHPLPDDEEEEDLADGAPEGDAYAFAFVEAERFMVTVEQINEIGTD
jgi:hypothetical protein